MNPTGGPFNPGDLAVLVGAPDIDFSLTPGLGTHIGEVCEIMGPLAHSPLTRPEFMHYAKAHPVRFMDGFETWLIPRLLRKIDPDKAEDTRRDRVGEDGRTPLERWAIAQHLRVARDHA